MENESEKPFDGAQSKEKRNYELAVLLTDDAAEPTVAGFLSKHQLEIYHKEGPRAINLAYAINKHTGAHLAVYYFSALPEIIPQLKEDLKAQSDILRLLLITPPIERPKKFVARELKSVAVDIKPPRTETVTNEALEETLEKILQ